LSFSRLLLRALGAGALIAIAPVAEFAVQHRDVFFARTNAVSILDHHDEPDLLKALWSNTVKHLEMFNVQGDRNGRHNLPNEPMLDPIVGALALLGTTLTSYVYYWQTIEEREELGKRPRRLAQMDAGVGMVVATAIFWFILVATGATLGVHHQQVQTAQDAAGVMRELAE